MEGHRIFSILLPVMVSIFYVAFLSNAIRKKRIDTVLYLLPFYKLFFMFCGAASVFIGSPDLYKESMRLIIDNCTNFYHELHKIPSYPCIIMSNYNAKNFTLSYGVNTLFENTVLVARIEAQNVIERLYDKVIYVDKKKGNYYKIKKEVQKYIKKGYKIFCYIEASYIGSRADYDISALRTGMFSIAKELEIPIVPVVMDPLYSYYYMVNYDFRIFIKDPMFITSVEKSKKNVLSWMKNRLRTMSITNS